MPKRLVTGELYYQPEPELGQGWKFYHYRGRGEGVVRGPFKTREDAEAARDALNQWAEAVEAGADETVSLPAGIFAVVDGHPIAFILGHLQELVSGSDALPYAKAQRALLRQRAERLDRWIELAKREGLPKP